MFNNYGDCVVLRDSDPGAVYAMSSTLRIPIINAGNGIDEHPTQAMADLYTMFKWRRFAGLPRCRGADRIRIGVERSAIADAHRALAAADPGQISPNC